MANLNKPEDPCGSILICPHLLFSHMELVSCPDSLLLGYTINYWSRSSFIECFAGACGTASPEVLVGTRVLNLDNVGELHDKVKGLFNVLLLNLR